MQDIIVCLPAFQHEIFHSAPDRSIFCEAGRKPGGCDANTMGERKPSFVRYFNELRTPSSGQLTE